MSETAGRLFLATILFVPRMSLYSTRISAGLYGRGALASGLLCFMPEGHQVARITCNRCRRAVDIDPAAFRGMRGVRLYRSLRCSRCGAREADVSIRWELGPAPGVKTN